MARVFIGVGSNINPRANVRRALRRLAREGADSRAPVQVVAVSTVYRTAPVGGPMGGLSRGKPDSLARSARPRAHQGVKHGPWFYNCVVEIATEMPPAELRAALRRIEAELGRRRTVGAAPCGRPFTAEACPPVVRRGGCATSKYAPRTIDLDVLLYDDLVTTTIPDPQIAQRAFLALPLWELAPELVLPDSGPPIAEVAAAFSPRDLRALPGYTELLRRDIAHEPGESRKPHPGAAGGDRGRPRA